MAGRESKYADIGQLLINEGSLTFTTVMFEAVNRYAFLVAQHHREICLKLDQILKGQHPTNRLMLNMPPRHSKTELAVADFSALGFAINPASEFMHLSSSEQLIVRNVSNIRRIMENPNYRAFFPETILSNDAKGSIYTTAGGVMYAAPFMGQITGFGCGKLGAEKFSGAMLIDDPMKAQDSHSTTIKEKISALWSTTFKNRLNDVRTPVIVTAQRLALDDFCGYLIDIEGTIEEGGVWDVVKFPAIIDEGLETERALWEARYPLSDLKRYRELDPWTFDTQYMQNPTPLKGLLYSRFQTYEVIPTQVLIEGVRKNYTDTADKGTDFLCSVNYYEHKTGIYVVDVLYTQAAMEVTEQQTARMITEFLPTEATIESNNGGRGFRRNVEKECRLMGNLTTAFADFTQTANKETRILTNSATVQNMVYYPKEWETRFPAYAKELKTFKKDFKANPQDGAADVMTWICEKAFGYVETFFGYL